MAGGKASWGIVRQIRGPNWLPRPRQEAPHVEHRERRSRRSGGTVERSAGDGMMLWRSIPRSVTVAAVWAYGLTILLLGLAGTCVVGRYVAVPSPDGRYLAAAYDMNLGAMTPFVTFVEIRTSPSLLNSETGSGIMSYDGRPSGVVFHWVGEKTLLIEYACERRLRQRYAWRDVSVTYRKAEIPGAECHA